jgi:hypothetical protein
MPGGLATDPGAAMVRPMRQRTTAGIVMMLLAAACGLIALQARAAETPVESSATGGGAYAVQHWTVDGGGGRSSGGTFAISGTIAQADADPLQPSSGGSYAITGGFWPGLTPGDPTAVLFADGFEAP